MLMEKKVCDKWRVFMAKVHFIKWCNVNLTTSDWVIVLHISDNFAFSEMQMVSKFSKVKLGEK